jgi:hypothetical protein
MQLQLAGPNSTDRKDVLNNLKNKLYFRILYYRIAKPKNDRL